MVSQRGFTLVEMLVVLVILGITITFTTLGFERLQSDPVTRTAGQFSAWLQATSDDTVLLGAIFGAKYDARQRRFMRLFYHDYRWRELAGDDQELLAVAEQVRVQVVEGSNLLPFDDLQAGASAGDSQPLPDILFLPNGETQPAQFRVVGWTEQQVAWVRRNDDGVFTWGSR